MYVTVILALYPSRANNSIKKLVSQTSSLPRGGTQGAKDTCSCKDCGFARFTTGVSDC